MEDYKICVYAICKNEEKFVERFMNHVQELKDHVYILDTGSEDNTVQKFKELGAHVQIKKYENFDFSQARNDALSFIPNDYDICICLDLDDCIEEGFLNKIKENWDKDTTMLSYYYIYDTDALDNPTISFQCEKIHKRDSYKWKYPVHELLQFIGEKEQVKAVPEIVVRHRPDWGKSRDFYLNILEEYVKNNPLDRRNVFLLAREYKHKCQWEKCIKMCHKYIDVYSNYEIPFEEELGQTYSYLTKSYCALNYFQEARLWGIKCLKNNKRCRTPYVNLLKVYYKLKEYDKALAYGFKALEIKEKNKIRAEDRDCWDGTIEDDMSLCFYYLGNYDKAIEFVEEAIKKQPNNERLKKNREIYIDKRKKN